MYTYIPISPPSCISFLPSLSHPNRWSQSTELISLCYAAAFQAIYFTFGSAYMSMLVSHFILAYTSHSLCPQVHFLHLRLYSCPVQLGSSEPLFYFILFLDSTYMCQHTVFVFSFRPTSLCMTDSRSIHLTTNNSVSFLFMAE